MPILRAGPQVRAWHRAVAGKTFYMVEVIVEEFRVGHYKDKYGNWHPDRRAGTDRRNTLGSEPRNHERRKMFRRKADRELLCQDRELIDEALEDFAEKHQGHL